MVLSRRIFVSERFRFSAEFYCLRLTHFKASLFLGNCIVKTISTFGHVSALMLLAVAGISTVSGCGPSFKPTPSTEQSLKVSGKEDLKKRLLSVAETGNGGSGLAGMREAIGALKVSDAALADQLIKEFGRLEQAEDAEQIKALAKQMAEKL